MAENKLFRKAALDRLSSPEQLHTLMRVTNAKGWLALVGFALIIGTAIAWGVVGSVQTKVSASGILLGGGGLAELDADGEGDLTSIDVKTGDLVKTGQVVAQVAQPALEQQIASQQRRLDELDNEIAGATPSATQAGRRDRLKAELERLKKQHEDGSRVVSGIDGRVVELRAVVGERVVAGRPIVAIERASEGPELEALLYFDSYLGKSLKPGMTIEIVPSVVRKERHGVLLGKVKVVEQYPSTRLGMMGALRNEQLVDAFIQSAGGAPIAVRATILPDKSTPSGYRWSSGAGPDVVLTSGTRCAGAVITRTHRPIALVFPALDYGG
jgi:biotin carboxyl carrier protein